MITMVIVLVIAWFVQNCLHEASHLIMAWKVERRHPISFKPYPHYEKRIRKWVFSFCEYGSPLFNSKEEYEIYSAPLWMNTWSTDVCFLAIIILAIFNVGREWELYVLLFIWCSAIDSLVWLWTFWWGSPTSDGQQYRKTLAKLSVKGC
jgi:hypothetical protein